MRSNHKFTSLYMLDLFISFFSVFLSLNTIIDSSWYKIFRIILMLTLAIYFLIAFICFIVFKIKGSDSNTLHSIYIKMRKYCIAFVLVILLVMMFIFCIGRTFPDNTDIIT